MKHSLKRALALLLTLVMILGIVPMNAFAAETRYSDTSGHWAASVIERWSDNGVLAGHNGQFRPNAAITRAEMAAVLNQVMGYQSMDGPAFSDVSPSAWYYDNVRRLAAAGIAAGVGNDQFAPERSITREEAVVMIGRAFQVPGNSGNLNPAADAADISGWASFLVNGMRAAGYIGGYPDGSFCPKNTITRAEVVTVIDNIVKAFYNAPGEYSGNVNGNAVVRADGVTLKDMKISSDLYLTEGVGSGDVMLDNVTVTQTTRIRGGGPNSIRVTGGDLGVVELNSLTKTHLALSADTKVTIITILNTGTVTHEGVSVAFDAVTGSLNIGGTIDKIVLNADGSITLTAGGIDYEIIPPEGMITTLTLTDGSVIKEMDLSAPLHITGTGQIDKLYVHASGSVVDGGVNVKLENIIVDTDITITIGGKAYTGTGVALTAGTSGSGGSGGSGGGGGGSTRPATTATVTFDTNGGSSIAPVSVPLGGTLPEVPMPIRENYAFAGWFTDSALSAAFYQETPINANMSLYADYTDRDNDLMEYTDPSKYIDDCDPNHPITILSPVTLTKNNLSSYIEITSYYGELPELSVTGSGGSFVIRPVTPYPAGGHFGFKLLASELSFDGESEDVRKLAIRIYKAPIEKIEFKVGIKYVLWEHVNVLDEDVYSVLTGTDGQAGQYTIATDDTVCFWDGEYNDNTRFCKIMQADDIPADGDDPAVTVLYVRNGDPADVFDDVDIRMDVGIDMLKQLQSLDLDQLALDVKNSEGAMQITEILAATLNVSPTIQTMSALGVSPSFQSNAAPDDAFYPVTEHSKNGISVKGLVDGLTITASIGIADENKNFPVVGDYDWSVLTLTFHYETVLKGKVEIDATFEVKEYVNTTMQGWKEWHKANLHFDYALNTYSQTDIMLKVLVRSKDSSDKGYINITEEITKLINPDSDDEDGISNLLTEVLGAKGDYISLVDVELFTASVPVIPIFPVFQVNIGMRFVIKVNFAAGISAETTLMAAKQIGVAGSMYGGIESYSNSLSGNDRYSFDFFAAGYAGLKAGLNLSLTISFYGLKSLGEVGVYGEVGAYIDLYGFMHLNISKFNEYRPSTLSLNGGLYLEVGIYLEIGLIARSDAFKVKAEYAFADIKIPLFKLGSRYVLYKLKNTTDKMVINTESYPLAGSNGLLDAEYIDITTGKTVTGSLSDPSKFSIYYSSPYFETVNNTITIQKDKFGQPSNSSYYQNVPVGTKRLETTAYIYYNGSSLTFGYDKDGKAYKKVDIIWIDSSVSLSQYPDIETRKATYVIDINGIKTTLDEKTVLFGEVPGSITLPMEYRINYMTAGYDNDVNAAITQDTVYTIYLTPYQRLISFITCRGGTWHLDVYPTNAGEMPTIPAGHNSPGQGLTFAGWMGESFSGGLPPTNTVLPMTSEISKYGSTYLYNSLDTKKTVLSVSGTKEDCLAAFYSGTFKDHNLRDSSLYLYTAQYSGGPYTIHFVDSVNDYTYTQMFSYDQHVYCAVTYWHRGYEFLGWDANGDGQVDYPLFGFPRAYGSATYTALFRKLSYTVDVLDLNGTHSETLTVDYGDLPDILTTKPDHPTDPVNIIFDGWLVTTEGGESKRFSRAEYPGVYGNWTIKPVYDIYYEITFDYAGGVYALNTFETHRLKEGTYHIVSLIDARPVKNQDNYNTYEFSRWDCGDSFTVTGDMTISAQYTATPIEYTATFETERGVLPDGKDSVTFKGGYDEWNQFITDYLKVILDPVNEADKTYTFSKWALFYDFPLEKRYRALWDSEEREYTVTFDGGDGYDSSSKEKTLIENMAYGTTSYLLRTGAFVKDEDGYGTYILSGWKDDNGKVHSPGAEYTVTGEMTFTAVYEFVTEKTYTVTFRYMTETDDQAEYIGTYKFNETITDVPIPPSELSRREFIYTFSGFWQVFGLEYKYDVLPPVTQDVAYIADYIVSAAE